MILYRFRPTVASLDGNSVSPKEVTKFLGEQTKWGVTTRCGAITAIKRAWKWAKDEGHLTLNPLEKLKKPRPKRREEIPDDQEIDRFLAAAKPEFRQLLDFLHATGCRPGEASMIERRHLDLVNREVRFRIGEDKTSGKTGRPRVIHLNETATAILSSLLTTGVTGPLFRNSRGRPWNEHSISCAVRKIRERAGLDERVVAYALRHHWATDALARGVPLATVAEMMGNSPEMVAKVYSHLSDKKALLLAAANQVRPPQ
jgi:integrase